MMRCWALVVVALAAAAVTAAESVLEALETFPSCGKACFLAEVASNNCNVTSFLLVSECLCPSVPALRNISTCVQTSCDLTDLITISVANQQLCSSYPKENRGQSIVTCVAIMSGIALALIILRTFTRLYISRRLWGDDAIVLICVCIAIAAFPMLVILTQKGFGKHVWDIDLRQVPIILKLFYVLELIYIAVQVLAKVSLILFYLRVFPQRWFRLACHGVIAWLGLHGVIYIFITAFQCLPLTSLWDLTLPLSCLDKSALVRVGAYFAIAEDVVILALPIPCISILHLSRSKRWGVGFMFAVGSFSLVTSCVRLRFLRGFGSMSDPTWDNLDVLMWSEIEVHSAACCACVPALRQLVVRVLPRSEVVQDSYVSSNDRSSKFTFGGSVSHARELDNTQIWPLREDLNTMCLETASRSDGDRVSTSTSDNVPHKYES